LTYSVWHVMSLQFARFTKSFCATKKSAFKCLLFLRLAFLLCWILGFQLIWILFIRLNGLQILLLVNFLKGYFLHRFNGLYLWLIIFNLPKILPILTKILLCLKGIHNLLGDLFLLQLQNWLHHLHEDYLFCIRKSQITTNLHLIYFI